MIDEKRVLIISGPTATGKTHLSIETAQKYDAEIVNFDSLLFYNELNIGVAKPTLEELSSVPHHMVSIASIAKPYNAAMYMEQTIPLINEIHGRNRPVILVGGSGFYLQAILQGMYNSPTTPLETLEKSNQLYEDKGIEPFREILKSHDPLSFDRYHENDHYRTRRAVEHFWTTGEAFSSSREVKEVENREKAQWPSERYHWKTHHIYLNIPKDEHYSIILERTKSMIQQGLIQEVKNLLKKYTGLEKPLQSIGYKQTIQFLRGEIATEEELVEKIFIATRRLAKSQRTWFNKRKKNEYNPLKDKSELLNSISKFMQG
ncbi:MAG: tRNA (adenosine(37)-N6)-dimethylallyltransferase MiaA [Halobacteriovoraceae bacterium]|nr:tRNA (adenosine(37)-N6)-dimethylallyltransferase MiaA [Halobacteriovoraceae bacterium]MCB9093641.1 tRNA (adenosine(37)-N6)-dimethylallyltransferase MiaA [Halobacteriovoraceae bacterium]